MLNKYSFTGRVVGPRSTDNGRRLANRNAEQRLNSHCLNNATQTQGRNSCRMEQELEIHA
jgi:hypothetical protein